MDGDCKLSPSLVHADHAISTYVTVEILSEETVAVSGMKQSRKEKRKALKKIKRKQIRTEAAIREREVEESRLNDPEEQLLLRLREQEEAEKAERERREFEERERLWLETAAARKSREEEDERWKKHLEEEDRKAKEHDYGLSTDDEYEYVDEGPAEIIWQGNEIIVKKRKVKVAKRITEQIPDKEDDDRPTSNPLPPQSTAFASYVQGETAQEIIDSVAQQVPNFGTEQDKAHCPFHLKTGACRFGSRCSRVHFYPDKSCTLLIRNMYNGPGLTCEQDEGLEYTDEEVEHCYEEFYEDVHTEFLKFGEIVNFKVCKNSSYHLRGNLYVHYKSLESAILAYNTMNGRYYAGKQIICDFVGVTKWKVAICGEYMKSRLKTCSHGSACNFIHCFRNPGGDYEWADWDNPPPRYWVKRMIFLFGASVEPGYDKELESEDYKRHSETKRMRKSKNYRHQSERVHDKEMDLNDNSSDGEEELNSKKVQYSRHSTTREHSIKRRARHVSDDKNEQQFSDNHRSDEHFYSRSYCSHSDDAGEASLAKKHRSHVANMPEHDKGHERRHAIVGRSSSSSKRKGKLYSEELENSESKSHKKHSKKQVKDRRLENSDLCRERTHSPSNVDSFHKHSSGSKNQFDENYSSNDLDSDEDYGAARYRYRIQSSKRRHDKHSSQQRRSQDRYIAGKASKGRGGEEESDESPGRWKASDDDFLVEKT